MSGLKLGDNIFAVKPSRDQPRPNGPQDSRCALATPQSRSLSRAYSSALLRLGEPVKRGPVTSNSGIAADPPAISKHVEEERVILPPSEHEALSSAYADSSTE